jgi:hypothetical protein
MRWEGIIAGAALAALAFVTDPAFAGIKQIGQTFVNGGSHSDTADAFALGVFDPPDTAALLVAAVYHADASRPPDRLVILFPDKKEWAEFVSLWTKARHAKRPTEDQVYSGAAEVGSYFDPAEESNVTISLDSQGDIDFAMAGKPDADKHPTVITLISVVPGDFKAFDQNVSAISAYFGKQEK